MKRKSFSKFFTVFLIGSLITIGLSIILYNLNSNITFFYPVSEIQKVKNNNQPIRIGGTVKIGSIKKFSSGDIRFILTDKQEELEIYFKGMIPLLFRENQWIIVKGVVKNNIFQAQELLIKHDEVYRPK